MTKRVCRDCPTLIPAGTRSGRCPSCERSHDASRGTSAARGYGARHRRLSERQRRDAIGQTCWMCGKPMLSDQPLALDHTEDRQAYRGVVHLSCNSRDGAARRWG